MKPRFFIGPMSKNVVDAVIACANERKQQIGLIPSRRQIDYDGGYSNNWVTKDWRAYVKSKSEYVILERDHGGPMQGKNPDAGYDSLYDDCYCMDIIHIDPWKWTDNFTYGVDLTKEYMSFCYSKNPRIKFEIGTEEAIFPLSAEDLKWMLNRLDYECPHQLDNVEYVVIQSGTAIMGTKNIGNYSEERLVDMIGVCREFGLLSKEHNGDYLSTHQIKEKFDLGLDAINIAPEFGVAETEVILEYMKKSGDDDLITVFYDICFESGKWQKWMPAEYIPERRWGSGNSSIEKMSDLIRVSGHYVFSTNKFMLLFKKLEKQYPDIHNEIIFSLKNKINGLLDLC